MRKLSIFGLRVIKMVSGTARACGYMPKAVRRNARRRRYSWMGLSRALREVVRNSYVVPRR